MSVTLPTETAASAPIVRGRRRGSSRHMHALRAVLAAVVVGLLSAGSASPAVAGDTCANAAVRAQSNSTGLPDCRAYEMVSPPYKEGFQVEQSNYLRYSDDGIVSYASTGTFAGNPQGLLTNRYHGERSATGWITTALAPPDLIYNTLENTVQGESADLRWTLWVMSRRDVPGDKFAYYLRSPEGTFTRVGDGESALLGPQPFLSAVSTDLSHVVFNYGTGNGLFSALQEYVGTGNDGPPRTLSVDNHGQPTQAQTCFNKGSADGRVIIYTSGCRVGTPQVWARVAGSAAVAVSGSECTRTSGDLGGPCSAVSPATYAGAALDGSRVFFTTSQQLVNGDTDEARDLYACDIPAGAPAPVGAANPCARLTQLSGTATNAQVENVISISNDGSRVYFVAQGALASNLGIGDVGPATPSLAVPTPHNLYVWERDGAHPAGTTRFVARLDDNDIDTARAQMTPDGRYLLFLTASKLVTEGPGADTDSAVDAYRYDAVNKVVVRVSTSVTGSGGNDSGFGVTTSVACVDPRNCASPLTSMTADGSTVIFDTAEALSAGDTDGVADVYGWHDDGRVSLISAGGGTSVGVTPSGRDIFFTSDAPVLAADGDFNKDIYDARVGGGFAQVETAPCSGDGCRGQRSQPPSLPGPAAPTSDGSDGVAASPAFSLRAVSAAQRKKLAATGKVDLAVTANAPGTIGVKASATVGGRSTTVGSARRTLAAPGKVTVPLALSKKARSQLAARGRLTVRVAVSHSKVALDRSVTLRLVHAKTKAKKSAKRSRS